MSEWDDAVHWMWFIMQWAIETIVNNENIFRDKLVVDTAIDYLIVSPCRLVI